MRRRHTRKKVVAKVSRCEHVYKRTGEPSVPYCERGGTTARVTDFSAKKNRNGAKSVPTWCSRPGSNRYAFMGHGILSLFLKSLYKFIFLYIKPYKPNSNKNYKVFKL